MQLSLIIMHKKVGTRTVLISKARQCLLSNFDLSPYYRQFTYNINTSSTTH